MRTMWLLIIGCLTLALLAGCSDKQEEAAQLEQEMRDLESGDSTGGEPGAVVDTSTVQQPVADAAAIPDESQPAPAPMPPAPMGEGYTVQVASCENQEYARHLIEVYTNRGYDPYVTTITYEGRTYFRVRIGNFSGRSEAQALQDELKDRFSVDPWIDRLDQ